jgi:hypothetical protein
MSQGRSCVSISVTRKPTLVREVSSGQEARVVEKAKAKRKKINVVINDHVMIELE